MKSVHGNSYFAVEALAEIPSDIRKLYQSALPIQPNFSHNLVKIHTDVSHISLLLYPDLDTTPHPALAKSCTINLETKTRKISTYSSGNPVILHQLETMLSKTNPRIPELKKLTAEEKKAGLFDPKIITKIGRLKYWNDVCRAKGQLKSIAPLPARSTTDASGPQMTLLDGPFTTPIILRHNTAMSIKQPSTAVRYCHESNIIKSVVYDYGCGKGRDTNWLRDRGYEAIAYDPYFCPANSPEGVDFSEINTVLVNFVLNVIENPSEREALLAELANKAQKGTTLIISVRSAVEIEPLAKRGCWLSFSDGYVTSKKTFQHGYTAEEFRNVVAEYFNIVELVDQLKRGIFCVAKKE